MTQAQVQYGAQSKYFGNVAENYDSERRKQNKWQIEQSMVRDFVADAKPGETVLDVPFGTGRFAEFYLDRQLQIHGVDISDDMLSQAKAALGEDAAKCQLQAADALNLPFDDNSFDFLVCNRFIKWLPEAELVDRALSEFARVSRGQILLQWNVKREKNIVSRYVDMIFGKQARSEHNPNIAVKTKYRESVILDLCRKNGLEVLKDLPFPGPTSGVRYFVLKAPGHR